MGLNDRQNKEASEAQIAIIAAAQAGSNFLNQVDSDLEVQAVLADTNPTLNNLLGVNMSVENIDYEIYDIVDNQIVQKSVEEGLVDFIDALDNLGILDDIFTKFMNTRNLSEETKKWMNGNMTGGKKRRSSKKAKKTSKKSSKRKSSKKSKKSM